MLAKRPVAALAVLLFFGVALLGAQTARAGLVTYPAIAARPADHGRAPVGHRKAFKCSVYTEGGAASSDGVRLPARYLTPRERRIDIRLSEFSPLPCDGIVPAQKVSTNLFLSVLNL
ncbi:MAG TPA: hypothetical protein VI231_10680 [Candidatus Binatia bacterium]|jgi:hypothetical protein